MTTAGDRPVVVVTGGGAGIGAAIAMELGRRGAFVVTVDPMVTLDGTGSVDVPETTVDRIVAAGGAGLAAPISVTDSPAVTTLLTDLVTTHGRLDAVVNVAGISRRTSYTTGTDDEWRSVLTVHLDGWLTILGAALPLMAAAGRGRILGVTSGSGWRPGDAGAYACAKRAVAALTWQLGRQAPAGVTVNAFSPIAVTRMVVAARASAPAPVKPPPTAKGGLSLGSMPEPEDIGPLVAWLVNDAPAFSGEILFAGGSEVAVLDRPRLLEVMRTDNAADLAALIDATAPALAKAEAAQLSGGGSNPRFTKAYGPPGEPGLRRDGARCLVVSDRPPLASAVVAALDARGVSATVSDSTAADAIAGTDLSGVDAVVLARSGDAESSGDTGWQGTLTEHRNAVTDIYTDARWGRAVADVAEAGRPMRIVTVTDATTAGGRSRGQAAAQLARAAIGTSEGRVEAFAVSAEGTGAHADRVAAELAAHLVVAPDAAALSGAELATGDGWFGLRSHPRAAAGFTLGTPEIPAWFGDALLETIDAKES
ncbi:MAG TPA: SDR family NAD(P)-dependent oxidoreductase [Mycobacteriales bacterium]|nr:SDR family NAD(P)-dependent oxidoreductase [Mycobacteriales bacterium]